MGPKTPLYIGLGLLAFILLVQPSATGGWSVRMPQQGRTLVDPATGQALYLQQNPLPVAQGPAGSSMATWVPR